MYSGRLLVAPSSAATVASPRPTRRRRWSSRGAPSRRPRSWPSRTPSTPASSSTAATADWWTPTAATTARCRPSRRRLAFTVRRSATRRTYTASSRRRQPTADTHNTTPAKTCTHRSVRALRTHRLLSRSVNDYAESCSGVQLVAGDSDILVLKLISVLVFILFSGQNFYFI